jgi:hypothetical protein
MNITTSAVLYHITLSTTTNITIMAGLNHHHPIPSVLSETPEHIWPQKLQPDMLYINIEECQTTKYVTTIGAKVDKGLVGLCLPM